MKTHITIGLPLLLLALTACQNILNEGPATEKGITATIARDDGTATRASMVDTPAESLNLRWLSGDAIGVFDSNHQNTRFEAAATDISEDGAQAVFRAGDAVPQAAFLAYYPFESDATGDATTLSLHMPATQQYTEDYSKSVPDPAVCMMVGSGYADYVSFRNIFAILKIGYVPNDADSVTGVVFSDLSGQPVSGGFTVTLSADGAPQTTFPADGEGKTLTLNCGGGVRVEPNAVSTFFLVVPAREYAKGFQIVFKLASGTEDVRTVGSKAGKTLMRSMVYCVGDASVISKDEYTLVFGEDGGLILDDDLLAMVQSVKSLGSMVGEEGLGTYYELMVKPELGLQVGMSIIINRLSEALPKGLAGKVVDVNDLGSVQQVRVFQYADASRAFKKLMIGNSNAINEDGTPNEEGMVHLDLSRYFSYFIPAEGMEGVTLEANEEGLVLTDHPATRASRHQDFNFLRFAINLVSSEAGDRVSFGGTPGLEVGFALYVDDYELQYCAFSLTPSLKVDFIMEKTFELANFVDQERPFGTWLFAPIPAGPVVIVPEIRLSGFVSVKGELKIKASWSYTMGFRIGATYQNSAGGSGFLFRCSDKSQPIPSAASLLLPDLSGSIALSTKVGLVTDIGISLYGLVDFTLFSKFGMELSTGLESSGFDRNNYFIQMAPVCEAGGGLGVLGALGVKPARSTAVQTDPQPWWSRSLYPYIQMYRNPDYVAEGGAYYVLPLKSTKYIPVLAKLRGMLLDDNELWWYITKRPKGSSVLAEETVVAKIPAGSFPGSSLFYSGDNIEEMSIKHNLPVTYFDNPDDVYSITIYCKAKEATTGQKAPAYQPLGCVEVTRVNDIVWGGEKLDVFLIRDDGGGAELMENGQISTYSGSRR